MFTPAEASMIKQEFWTTFGKYMNPILSSEGTKINWVNYHTRLKDVNFKMDADQKSAIISISIQHTDPEIQELYFEQFLELKNLLHESLGEQWEWELHARIDRKVISQIYKKNSGVSIFNRDQWPELISFFKPRIIALDSFWENARYTFEMLK